MTQATQDPTVALDPAARAALAALVGSLADTKARLGRRYGEWAVSAPTLESAVAAAAMAQDELGHARSTYPLLKLLGDAADRSEEVEGGAHLPVVADPLPDWETLVAVNLVADGMLSAFVEACADSALDQLAQRARKIRQEERSHAVHAAAWARRLWAAPAPERFADALVRCWGEAARWAGPDDDAGFAALRAAGLVARGPAQLRADVRARVVAALGERAVEGDALPDPADWSGWSPELRR